MTDESRVLEDVRRLRAEGHGDRVIGRQVRRGDGTPIGKHTAARLITQLRAIEAAAPRGGLQSAGATYYETAVAALAEAARIDEVIEIRDQAERIKLYARQQQDRSMLAHATEIRLRAGRRLGAELAALKAADGLQRGGRPAKTCTTAEQVLPPTLPDMGITRKISAEVQRLASISQAAFDAMVARTRERIIAGGAIVINPLRDLSAADKAARRAERESEAAARIAAGNLALPQKRYGVILADPEWRFEVRSDNGLDYSAANHYPTSPTGEIAARPVRDIAARDCVLFLWSTAPMLPDALHVMRQWGFAYKSHIVWDKVYSGTGYWFMSQHELLLLGTCGAPVAPAPGTQPPSLLRVRRGGHSEKPIEFYELIEGWYPRVPKIELNARTARPGWDRWGLDAPAQDGEPPDHDPVTGEVLEAAP